MRIYWDRFNSGIAPVLIGMFFLGAVILIFLGILGEYILSINQRIMNRPLVIESERINFNELSDVSEEKSEEVIPKNGSNDLNTF